MGRIRTKDIKDLAVSLHDIYPEKFAGDFAANKGSLNELKIVEGKSKRFRNRVAGYTVRLARRGKAPPQEEKANDEKIDE
jgi:ribosomal protein S17E